MAAKRVPRSQRSQLRSAVQHHAVTIPCIYYRWYNNDSRNTFDHEESHETSIGFSMPSN